MVDIVIINFDLYLLSFSFLIATYLGCKSTVMIAELTGAVEYADCISAEM